MNKHIIHGRLTRDPEFIQGEEESKNRAKFTVAVDRSYGDEADFIDCIVFGRRAAVVDKWYHKGKEILVEGEGRTGSYTDKNGIKRKTYTIVVGQLDFCGSGSDQKQDGDVKNYDSWDQLEKDNPF